MIECDAPGTPNPINGTEGCHTGYSQGADEYHSGWDVELVQASTATTLQHALAAYAEVGLSPPSYASNWSSIAKRLVTPLNTSDPLYPAGYHPEYVDYNGAIVKQADIVLFAYPYEVQQP